MALNMSQLSFINRSDYAIGRLLIYYTCQVKMATYCEDNIHLFSKYINVKNVSFEMTKVEGSAMLELFVNPTYVVKVFV